MQDLIETVRTLRAPGGCPWDRAQTLESMKPMLVEEVYEVLEAIESGSEHALRKELGDLLFSVLLIAQISRDGGGPDIHDAARAANDKMIRRHPHVFAGEDYAGLEGWEAIKAQERREELRSGGSDSPAEPSVLDGVPAALPALIRAQRISKKASAVGFDWPDVTGARAKLSEELAELDEAVDGANLDEAGRGSAIEEELGDVLFSVVNVARHLGVSAEDALRAATRKFEARFRALEGEVRAEGGDVSELDATALDARWQALKRGPA